MTTPSSLRPCPVRLQNFLRCQNNKTNYNLVCETLQFLDCICGSTTGGLGLLGLYINEKNVALINQTLESLTEYCQGPCHENQVGAVLPRQGAPGRGGGARVSLRQCCYQGPARKSRGTCRWASELGGLKPFLQWEGRHSGALYAPGLNLVTGGGVILSWPGVVWFECPTWT